MSFAGLVFLAFGLSMDAFAVSVCMGTKKKYNASYLAAFLFGLFQGIMPVIGYLLGSGLKNIIVGFDHWICFFLLAYAGIKMIYSSFENKDENRGQKLFELLLLALASSIDALGVGITLSFLEVKIIFSSIFIAVVTYIMSLIGIFSGRFFGKRTADKAELFGGIILLLIGLKILLDHLGIIT